MRMFAIIVMALALASFAHSAMAFSKSDLARLGATGKCPACDLSRAGLSGADLAGADLREANLTGADLSGADLSGADLRKASLRKAILLETNLEKANLDGSAVYGASAWGVRLKGARQSALVITPAGRPPVTVDNVEMAQFVYMLLDNEKLHDAIDNLTSKVVLVLGRFTPERKVILDSIRSKLKSLNYVPVIFDFRKPEQRDLSETVSLLARMSRFVIADITEAKSIPQELMHIVPSLPSVPVQPVLRRGASEYSMFEHFRRYPWVLKIHRYDGPDDIASSLSTKVIGPAEAMAREMGGR